jgi:GT2 family glycosyltransferase
MEESSQSTGTSSINSNSVSQATLPEVSIVIPVFNQAALTKACLNAIFQNTAEGKFEVIVVDNASTDETGLLLSSWGDRIRSVRNQTNKGFGCACNQGAKISRSKVLLFLNNDTQPLPGWFESCIDHFKRDENVGIVGNKLIYPDHTIQHCGIEFVSVVNPPISYHPEHRFRGYPEDAPEVNRCEEVHAITGACLFIRKELFNAIGGFSENYGMYYEDVDLNLQVRLLKKIIIYEPRSTVIHFERKSTSQQTHSQFHARAKDLFYQKWEGKLKELFPSTQVFGENLMPNAFDKNVNTASNLESLQVSIGINTDLFRRESAWPLEIPGRKEFLFLCISDGSHEEGWDVLLKGYSKAFSASDSVSLLLQIDRSASNELLLRQIADFFESLKSDNPHLILNCYKLPIKLLLPLYRTSDVFVLCLRNGEFKRQYMEAMAMALPTLGTRWGSQLDFMNDENSYLIQCEPQDRLAEPLVSHTATLMRRVYENRDEARLKGVAARRQIHENFNLKKLTK